MNVELPQSLSDVDAGVALSFLGFTVGSYGYSAAAAQFYRSISDGRFKLPYCATCDTYQHPRREICPQCLSTDLLLTPTSTQGELYSFSVMHSSPFDELQAELPYAVGIVTLGCGVALFGRLDADVEQLHIGDRFELNVGSSAEGIHFVPAGGEN